MTPSMIGTEEAVYSWWKDLRHGGLLITPELLPEFFPCEASLSEDEYRRLRAAHLSFVSGSESDTGADAGHLYRWLDEVLETFLKLRRTWWEKASAVQERFRSTSPAGERLAPDRVLLSGASDEDGAEEPALFVWVDKENPRVGMGRGQREVARLVQLLRSTGVPLGLLTNGRQFRLIHAGLDHEAWAEWTAEEWFETESGRQQLKGLKTILQPKALRGEEPDLLAAVRASRERQGDLSLVLGEQVREAVELLITRFDEVCREDEQFLQPLQEYSDGEPVSEADQLQAIYRAATRLVMRLVVLLYAEARELLPAGEELYYQNYSVEGLYEMLRRARENMGPERLRGYADAWSRVLGLFNLVYYGSAHEYLPIVTYGGDLFRPGSSDADDLALRTVALFEDERFSLDNAQVLDMLSLLKVGKLKVYREGRATWVSGPVDFSELRTEYIGIMYEGLLDYELKRASEPMVVLGIGDEPVLPLTFLESEGAAGISDMVSKLEGDKEESTSGPPAEVPEMSTETMPDPGDAHQDAEVGLYERAMTWARTAVEQSGMVRRVSDPSVYARRIDEKADQLVRRIIPAGSHYVARWGGSRKGSGTFYTRPGLSVPTTHRTLEPLAYRRENGERRVRAPSEILQIKVCDPAMGSGSFLVAALRYLAEALTESLLESSDRYLHSSGSRHTLVTLPRGQEAVGDIDEELLPVPPEDGSLREHLYRRAKRHVVQRCIYGVDKNPTAVELARLSLWLETMDRELPFEFLDHKLKCGDSLIGCWYSRFRDYPARAWYRDGGDSAHSNGVHYEQGRIQERIRELRPEVKEQLRSHLDVQVRLNDDQQLSFITGEIEDPLGPLTDAAEAYRQMQELPAGSPGEREEIYRKRIENSAQLGELKRAFDRWCAVWFWPFHEDVPALTPDEFVRPSPQVQAVVDGLAREHRFFHWELEFPEIFRGEAERRGFDAVLGNPPWDIAKPNSQEFFTNHDPIYRTYDKQAGLRRQEQLFAQSEDVEREWIAYIDRFKAWSHFVRESADPCHMSLHGTGPGAKAVEEAFREIEANRESLGHPQHPYRHQGSADLNTYKMFLEMAHHLTSGAGRLGFVVPAGIHMDLGSSDLRRLFLQSSRWEWLFSFENRKRFFPIDSRFKFDAIVVQRGGRTREINTAFMMHDLQEWADAEEHAMSLPRQLVETASPEHLSFPEVRSEYDRDILEKVYERYPRLGDIAEEWGLEFSTEFHMTNDSHLFTRREELIEKGLLGEEEDGRDPRVRARLFREGWLPLYEGKCVHQFNDVYRDFQYWIRREERRLECNNPVVWRAQARSTDIRTLIVASCYSSGYGNSLWTISCPDLLGARNLQAYLCCLLTDYVFRVQQSGSNVTLSGMLYLPVDLGSDMAGSSMKLSLPWADLEERMITRVKLDCILFGSVDLSLDQARHIMDSFPLVDKNLPRQQRYTTLVLQAYEHLLQVGRERFIQEGWELPPGVTGEGRPMMEFWSPEDGWVTAWKEARDFLSEDEWREFTEGVVLPELD